MLTLFGDLESGNVHKAQMILHRAGVPYRRVDTAQVRGDPRTSDFLRINPIGKVPAVMFDDGDVLSESGAILYYFGKDTGLWPQDLRTQSEVLRWMFFEQYSHEPALAVIRYLKHHRTDKESADRVHALEPKARDALDIMNRRLESADWIACQYCSLADFALYPYTRVMDESGFRRGDYPFVDRWLQRMEEQSDILTMGRDGAEEAVDFSEYLEQVK